MKKKTPSEKLLSFSWIYIILSAIFVVALIASNAVPEVANQLKSMSGKSDVMLEFNVAIIVSIVFYLWYFLLARRAAHGISSGTLYMILLLLGIATKIVHAVTARSISSMLSLDSIVDVLGFYYLYKVRKAQD